MSSFVKALEQKELLRQQTSLNFIASENYPSKDVLEVLSGPFVNKYAEGSPKMRFYAGCQVVDQLENYGQELAKKIFKCHYANLQPHSGTCANWIAYFACCQPGDTILAMDLASGGHLTHGFSKSLTSKVFNFVHYRVQPNTLEIDYHALEKQAIESKAKMIVAGASSYPRLFDWKRLGAIAHNAGAILLADIAHTAGLIAGGVLDNPFPNAHLATLTTQKTLRGPRGGIILSQEFLASKIEKTVMPGFQGGPNMATVAAKIVALEQSSKPDFQDYCKQILTNCQAFCQELERLGLPAVSGGSDNHLLLLETTKNFGLTGKKSQDLLSTFSIDVNRNHLPDDQMVSSGIRIGFPAMTTRGMTETHARESARLIIEILSAKEISDTQRLIWTERAAEFSKEMLLRF